MGSVGWQTRLRAEEPETTPTCRTLPWGKTINGPTTGAAIATRFKIVNKGLHIIPTVEVGSDHDTKKLMPEK